MLLQPFALLATSLRLRNEHEYPPNSCFKFTTIIHPIPLKTLSNCHQTNSKSFNKQLSCTTNQLGPSNSASGSGSNDAPPPITPPDTVEIRFRRGSRRQKQQREGGGTDKMQASADNIAIPKKWEDMSLSEKAVELYMGEKGLLFWLNKFAYASIFIMIGAWILFRFVGPSLNLYQLDAPPLSPSDVLKGS